jgi:uncharacterized phage protein (TIGR01671 family)
MGVLLHSESGNYDEFENEHYVGYSDRFIVQMYTGVKDRLGKEIYEGDLVLFQRGCEKERVMKEYFAPVVFEDGAYGFFMRGFNDMFMQIDHDPTVEVLGTVFQNPEILQP